MHFMETMHRLLSKLDELVLLQKAVYKIESVANCYMVSCGAPHVSEKRDKLLRNLSPRKQTTFA